MGKKKAFTKTGFGLFTLSKKGNSPHRGSSSVKRTSSLREVNHLPEGSQAPPESIIPTRTGTGGLLRKSSSRTSSRRSRGSSATTSSCNSSKDSRREAMSGGLHNQDDAHGEGITQPLMNHGGFGAALVFHATASRSLDKPSTGTAPTKGGTLIANDNAMNSSSPQLVAGAGAGAAAVSSLPQLQELLGVGVPGGNAASTGFNWSSVAGNRPGLYDGGLSSIIGCSSLGSSAISTPPAGGLGPGSGAGAALGSSLVSRAAAAASAASPSNAGSSRPPLFTASEDSQVPHPPPPLPSGASSPQIPNPRRSSRSTGVDNGQHSMSTHSMPCILPIPSQFMGFSSSLSTPAEDTSGQSTEDYLRSTNFLLRTSSRSSGGEGKGSSGEGYPNGTGLSTVPTAGAGAVTTLPVAPNGNGMSVSFSDNPMASATAPGRSATTHLTQQLMAYQGNRSLSLAMPPSVPLPGSMFQRCFHNSLTANTRSASGSVATTQQTTESEGQAIQALTEELAFHLKAALKSAERVHAAGGNSTCYGFADKMTTMTLYTLVGLDENPDEGRPTRFQRRLQRFRFPPPQMEKLNSMDGPDEGTVTYMIGSAEARRRALMAVRMAEDMAKSREEPVAPFDEKAVVAEYAKMCPHSDKESAHGDRGTKVAQMITRPEEIVGHRREKLLVAMPYGVDSEEEDFDL